MSFDWSEYLRFAEHLTEGDGTPPAREAQLRSAVSRAYYAAFHLSLNHLRDHQQVQVPEKGNIHRWVIEQFTDSVDAAHRVVGANLDRLRDHRNEADYEDLMEGLTELAAGDVLLAGKILQRLAGLR